MVATVVVDSPAATAQVVDFLAAIAPVEDSEVTVMVDPLMEEAVQLVDTAPVDLEADTVVVDSAEVTPVVDSVAVQAKGDSAAVTVVD